MKYSNFRAFEKHLNESAPLHFAPIYLILGEDRFARKMAVDKSVSLILKGKGHSQLAVKAFGENSSIEEVMSELDAFSLFSEKKIVTIDDVDKFPKQALKTLEGYFSHPNASVYLILSATAINHATNFYKHAEKGGVVLEYAEEKAADKEKTLMEWAKSRLQEKGKSIELRACQILVKQVGLEMALLDQEIAKLVCYVGERTEIILQDVETICTKVNIENMWQLGEALFQRNVGVALRISRAILDEGTVFFSFIRQIRHQFQTEFQVCSILANGGTPQDVSKTFPYMRGFILDRHISHAKGYGMERFKNALQLIDEAEVTAKNSSLEHDFLTEMLMIKLAI